MEHTFPQRFLAPCFYTAPVGSSGRRGPERGGTPVHNPAYDFNDDLLPLGASYLAAIAERELG